MAAKKTTKSKKAPAKKAAAKKPAAKKAAAKKAPAKKAPAKKKTAAKKSAAKKPAAKKAPAKKKPAAKKPAAKKAAAKKAAAKKAPAKKKAEPKAPAKPKKPVKPKIPARAKYLLDKKWVASQKAELIKRRESYTKSADKLAADAAALMADREPGDVQFDEESGEGDTLAVERDRDLALSAQARQAVDEIDAALKRIEDGVYGLCLVSHDPIPKARLEYIPEASERVEHKTSMFV